MANLSDINEHLELYKGARVYGIFITIVSSICGILYYFGHKEAIVAVIALSFVITFFLIQFFIAFITNIIPKKLSSKDIGELREALKNDEIKLNEIKVKSEDLVKHLKDSKLNLTYPNLYKALKKAHNDIRHKEIYSFLGKENTKQNDTNKDVNTESYAGVREATKEMFFRYYNGLQLTQELDELCSYAISNIDTLPIDKLNRWLGYVQYHVISTGQTSIDKERDYSRPIFHAAYVRDKIPIPKSYKTQTYEEKIKEAQNRYKDAATDRHDAYFKQMSSAEINKMYIESLQRRS